MMSKPILKVNFHEHILWNSGYLELTYIQIQANNTNKSGTDQDPLQ